MKKYYIFLFYFFVLTVYSQENIPVFKVGEKLQYKMSYSGFLRAGTATLEIKEAEINDKKVFHAVGKGWTTGWIKWFFKVNDNYQTYFDKDTVKPYLFKRKINEGGYKIHRNITFNHDKNEALVEDFRKKEKTTASVEDVQDMLSTFYFLRSIDFNNLKEGDEIALKMFLDFKTYNFKLKFLGRETLKSSFGKVKTLIFRPLVQSGRIFKAEESVKIWVTDDRNKVPIQLKADLAVGSLRAELEEYKNLIYPLVTE
jgi:hypothetical protein